MCCEPTLFPWGYNRSPRGEFACLCGITSQFQSLCFHLPILGCFYQSHSRKLYFFQLISFLATLHCQQSICMALCHTGYRKAHLFYKHVVFCLPLFLAAPGRALSNMAPVSVRVGTHANQLFLSSLFIPPLVTYLPVPTQLHTPTCLSSFGVRYSFFYFQFNQSPRVQNFWKCRRCSFLQKMLKFKNDHHSLICFLIVCVLLPKDSMQHVTQVKQNMHTHFYTFLHGCLLQGDS